MAKKVKNPVEQKEKLVEQLKDIEQKIAQFDEKRAMKIASIAKRLKIVDLADNIIEAEFKAIRDKYQSQQDATLATSDEGKKNS